MRQLFWILGLGFGLIFPASAVQFAIHSPDKADVWAKASISNRLLSWSEKRQALTAEITFSTADYGGNGTPTETETDSFLIPGVSYDDGLKQFFVTAPTGEKVVVAQRTKIFLGSRIDLSKVATIHISRIHTEISVTLNVDTNPPPDEPVASGPDDTQTLPLNSLIK